MEGEDADEATIQAVTQTYRELVACLNAGQFLRVYALYTDDYLRRTLADTRVVAAVGVRVCGIAPGTMALTRMPCGPRARASSFTSMVCPALDAL